MLLRPDGDAVICIGQPAHAWLSGQMAHQWGSAQFGPVEPREEVCLAAEQHDAGMSDWDAAPELNRETGLPYSFIEMPLATHMRLWTHAPERVLSQSRYAALLVSMHGTALYEMRDLDRMSPSDAQAVRAYLDGQRALQAKLAAGLEGEDPARIKRNQRLIWTWDFLSLALCLRWQGRSLDGVPTADGNGATVTVHEHTLDPWLFTQDAVTLHTEGRRLAGRFDDEDAMRAALAGAPWVTLRFDLSRGGAGG